MLKNYRLFANQIFYSLIVFDCLVVSLIIVDLFFLLYHKIKKKFNLPENLGHEAIGHNQ